MTLRKAATRRGSTFGLGYQDRVKPFEDIPGPLAVPLVGTTLTGTADNLDLKQANAG